MLIEISVVVGVFVANLICYACHEKSLLRGKLKGPRLLFISNTSARANKTPEEYWALDVLDPQHLVSSYILNDVCLLLLRVLSLGFFAVTLLLEGLTGDGFGNPLGWFTFFTNWTFLLFGIWSLMGVVLTGWAVQAKVNTAAAKGRGHSSEHEESLSLTGMSHGSSEDNAFRPLKMKWGPLSTTYLFTTEIVATSTLFLSFFYWTFLFSPKYPLEIDNLLKHGVNNIILLAEMLLGRTPMISYHYQACLLYGTGYTFFMWVYHAASMHWVYYILDWSRPSALALYIMNPLFLFAAFGAWTLIACCREWLGSRLQPSAKPGSLRRVDFQ